jgi:hypothetical protein
MLEQIHRVVAELSAISRAFEPGCVDGDDAATLVELATRGERLCASIKARAARRADDTKVWKRDGHRSAQNWLAEKTGETVGAAARSLETARRLDSLPETAAAFEEGELSETQAHEIGDAASADPEAEHDLLAAARTTSVKGLRDECRRVRAGAEADDRAWARRLHISRRVRRWTDPDGTYRADVRLAPTPALASTPPSKATCSGSSLMRAAPGGASLAMPMSPTRWWPLRPKDRASSSR